MSIIRLIVNKDVVKKYPYLRQSSLATFDKKYKMDKKLLLKFIANSKGEKF